MYSTLTEQVAATHRGNLLREAETARLAARARARRRGMRARVRLRPLGPADIDHLSALFDRLSPRSRHLRYLSPVPTLPEHQLRQLADIDHRHHEAIGAFQAGILVGAAHYVRSRDDPAQADISIEVADSHQRRGLGTRLVRELARRARQRGITRFTAVALSGNTAVPALLRRLGWPVAAGFAGPELDIVITLPGLTRQPGVTVAGHA
jgi:RimJ/RimL family protein N-acetyltransferase